MFPDKACAVACTWKAYLLLTRQFKNKKVNKRHFRWHYSHFKKLC